MNYIIRVLNGVGNTVLDSLNDVTITSAADDNILQYDSGTSQWVNSSVLDQTVAATTTDAYTIKVSGDSQKRFIVNGNGLIEWGSGSGATDFTLGRGGAGFADTNGYIRSIQGSAAAAFVGAVTGDSNNRMAIYTDGKYEWGSGSATRDTNLYRSAADTLKTDDALIVTGAFSVGSGPVQIDPASPATGHLLRYNGTKFVSVLEESIAQYPNHAFVRAAPNQTGISSTTYIDITSISLSFTKIKGSGTKLRLALAGSWYPSASSGGIYIAVLVNGTDYEMTQMLPSSDTNRNSISGFQLTTAIAAGTYTIKGRVKVYSGGSNVNIDVNDYWSLEVTEVKA